MTVRQPRAGRGAAQTSAGPVRLLAGLAVCLAALALLGWVWPRASVAARLAPEFPAMVPVTALFVLLLATSLWLGDRKGGQLAAMAVAAGAVLVLLSTGGAAAQSDRVAIGTALGALLLAASILLCRWALLSSLCASAVLLLSFWCLLGYLVDARALFDFPLLSGMSMPTALCLALLSLAALLRLGARSWTGLLIGPGAAARSARFGMVIALGLPVGLAMLLRGSAAKGSLPPSLEIALLIGVITAVSVAMVLALSRERARAETLQHGENLWLRRVFDTTGVAAMVFDHNGLPILSNRLAQDMTRGSGGPLAWLTQTRFFVPGSLEPLEGAQHPAALVRGAALEGRHYVGWIDPERGQRDLGLYVHRVTDMPGRAGIVILTVVDETESWAARDHITRIGRLEAVGLMASSASHEFGNIFGALQLTADVGQLTSSGRTRAQFDAVSEACRRGAAMTQRLLDLSCDGVAVSEPVELVALLREAEPLLNAALSGEVALRFELPSAPVTVMCNRSDLVAMLMNLALNGRDAIRDRPGASSVLTLRLVVSQARAAIEVEDHGTGMSEETLARAATPFYTSRRSGAGLGLSMADRFAQRNGGTLTLQSTLGTGTTARLELPLAGRALAVAPQGAPADALADLSGMRVLMVEDDPQFRNALSGALRSAGAVLARESAAEPALERLENGESFDLLLSDIRLPGGISGIALAQRAVQRCPGLPVLLMTGYHEDAPGVRDSAFVVLRKPMSLSLLSNAIRIVRADAADPGPPASSDDRMSRSALAPQTDSPAPDGSQAS
ncbi:response regulator [Citreicella sp. C3M06]|nr:response regulator [Citreicella sp. C3M06]